MRFISFIIDFYAALQYSGARANRDRKAAGCLQWKS
jgi:hypothetical protein